MRVAGGAWNLPVVAVVVWNLPQPQVVILGLQRLNGAENAYMYLARHYLLAEGLAREDKVRQQEFGELPHWVLMLGVYGPHCPPQSVGQGSHPSRMPC